MALTKLNSNLATFTQTGTGGQAITLQEKLGNTVNVQDFIPSGTNTETTDCSSYFQNAIDTGKTVYVPRATYRIDETLYLKNSYDSLIGHESMPTLRMTAEKTVIAIRAPSTTGLNEYSRVENFYLVRATSDGSTRTPNYRNQSDTVGNIDALAAVTLQSKTTDGTSSTSSTNVIQSTRLSNIRVRNFAVGFYFSEVVGTTVHKCFSQVDGHASATTGDDGVTFDSNAWSIGYYCNATPIREGSISPLARIEFVECDDNRNGTPTAIKSASYYVFGPDVRDIFWQRCECVNPQYGWYIDAGATNTTAGYDWDIHIFRPVIDAYSVNAIYLQNLNGIGGASIVGGYAAPKTGGNEAILIDDCNGVTITGGFQIIGNVNDDAEDKEDGIRLQNSTRCSIIGNRITNSRYGISLEASTLCNIHGNIIDATVLADANNVTLQNAIRLFADGSGNNCSYNTITGNVISGASTGYNSESNVPYSNGINIAAGSTFTTVANNKMDPAQITTEYANRELTIASGAITVWDSFHTVDTEGDASSDPLTTINGGEYGQTVILRAADSGRTVAVTEGGNISLNSSPRNLDNTQDTIMLFYDGATWLELFFSHNAS